MARRPAPDDLLLDTAAALVRRGEILSLPALAAAAGVAKGTVYRRYKDRDALVAALLASGRVAAAPEPEPDTRERILDAVGRVLRRKGLTATTLEEVAAEAEVAAITVYRRFGDRRGLLQAFVAERSPRRLAQEWGELTAGDRDAALVRLAAESIRFFREYRELFLLSFSADPEARALVAEARGGGSTTVRDLTASFLQAHFPDPSGRTVAAFNGLVMSVAWSCTGDPEEDARFLVSLFLDGARAASELP